MLTYQSYLRGNRAIGVSIKKGEVERNERLFNGYLSIPENRLSFRVHDLYEVESLGMQFDQIICSEVLEHIRRDEALCHAFWRILKPGGLLHLCCPNAEHPDHVRYPLDPEELGGHVRPGYTAASYRALLEPIGFRLSEPVGLGGPMRQACNKRITAIQESFGLLPGVLFFAMFWPLQVFDNAHPRVPYSLYVRATKHHADL
jgi:SAM-dependent methyltransferase